MTSRFLPAWRQFLLPLITVAVLGAQQPTDGQQQPAGGQSLADIARKQRAVKNGEAEGPSQDAAQPQKSLGELAAERRGKQEREVKVTEKDTKELFAEMDEILEFASQDSGLSRRASVKHALVSQADVQKYMASYMTTSAETQRIARSEIVLKKFGFLSPTFDLKGYLVRASGKSIAGYYDFRTKTMNLLNWVGLEAQRPIMAHELTHALQDQNYDLMSWSRVPERPPAMRVLRDEGQEEAARRAVVEGQAMIVFLDYILKPFGRTLADTPLASDIVKGRLATTYESSIVIHNAPLLMKETAMFPYREGLLFELELLHKGGLDLAFTGALTRPPANTHEILEPKAYLEKEKIPAVSLPDLSRILANDYEVYDSGTIGQLDARILTQELGSENDMFTIAPNWQGGAYVAVKRKPTAAGAATATSTADIALLYISRWKTPEAAERFLEVYQKSLSRRVKVNVSASGSEAQGIETSEGLVFLEELPNNTVFIAQSFPAETAKLLRQVVLTRGAETAENKPPSELSFRLMTMPGFQAFQEEVFREMIIGLGKDVSRQHDW
jgi:hypothetical protein